ncbi:DUF4079 domain-containing protein [Anabaena sp. FACHB-1237]|uniref:DUF4079 domain-containing protein n=1 Tax=Anabaena sp. FACHB-1237 TaxID=2692769 RepID=UPI001680B38F|nr:DUF4079 domain-containing protein [Anabaena sp. FACHB-1237]MBD2136134.1 DUF4079 domain-containing protein [Anabaena sp. FACHB-1237]
MHLPSFLWLWKIAAWSMGLSLLAYLFLAISGFSMFIMRTRQQAPLGILLPRNREELRSLHYIIGLTMVGLVLLLLVIGIIGTLGHFGNLGHSSHLIAGVTVVILTLISSFSATQISSGATWAKPLHITCNLLLFIGLTWVSITGWMVVQKYLGN